MGNGLPAMPRGRESAGAHAAECRVLLLEPAPIQTPTSMRAASDCGGGTIVASSMAHLHMQVLTTQPLKRSARQNRWSPGRRRHDPQRNGALIDRCIRCLPPAEAKIEVNAICRSSRQSACCFSHVLFADHALRPSQRARRGIRSGDIPTCASWMEGRRVCHKKRVPCAMSGSCCISSWPWI